jgi:hypothetical protein
MACHRAVFGSILVVALAACNKKTDAPAKGSDTATPASDAAATPVVAVDAAAAAVAPDGGEAGEADAAEAAATAPGKPTLTATGIASLPKDMVVDEQSLAKALPGFTIELMPEDDYNEERFVAKLDDELALEIKRGEGHKLASVSIESSKVATDLGFAVGSTYAEVTKAIGKLKCVDGADEGDGREAVVSCNGGKLEQLGLDFIDAAEDGTPKRPASEVIHDKKGLAKTKLVTILWQPS